MSPIPNMPAGPRKAKPKPFARPAIDLDRPAVPRTWQDLPAYRVAAGDTVVGVGKVVSLEVFRYDDPFEILVRLVGPELSALFQAEQQVKAFTYGVPDKVWDGYESTRSR